MGNFMANYGLILTYLLIFGAAFSAILFPLLGIIKNPKKSKQFFIYVLTFVFTFLISYLLASDEVFDGYKQFGVTPSNSKIVGSGLIFFYILSLLAVLLVVYSEIVKLFK
jgi:uncharacterized membrane protein|tara:strand:- start:1063 stop:1392 length:330 start_codon:yes stop_codon:yes gene_type:complete